MLFWLNDLLFSKFTEFLSIFYFSFLLLISVLSSYKKSTVICGRFTSLDLLDDQVQRFWLNDQMILGSLLLFAI